MRTDTICAPATAPGHAALSVIRISGEKALDIGDQIFRSKKKKKLKDQKPFTIHFGTIEEQGQVIDEVLVSIFHAPHSYTGENLVEISCHGSPFIQQKILELIIARGARPATAGEFTQRAFLNGKIDLSQAEAVADLIASESEASHRLAMQQMRGGYSTQIRKLRDELMHFISLIELELDFSEEDVEFADRTRLKSLLDKIEELLSGLIRSFQLGNVIKKGIPIAIAGKPNVGKSTLLNAILNEERALVSEIEGTTRDSIEDVIILNGYMFRFIDTAGIRKTEDVVESMGIRRTYDKIKQADVVLLLLNAHDDRELIDSELGDVIKKISPSQTLVAVFNKTDLSSPVTLQANKKLASKYTEHILFISAKKKENIKELLDLLVSSIDNTDPGQQIVVSNIRHYEAFQKTLEAIQRVTNGLEVPLPGDLLAQDIRQALHYLGEITGEITTDEILGNIFSKFCIGK